MSIWSRILGRGSQAAPRRATAATPEAKPSASPEQNLIEALKGIGYKKTLDRPTDPDAIVNTVVQAMLARQACDTDRTFETGEKNPQRILCSDNECPCNDRAALIIGSTAYLHISQAVVDFRKDCRTLLEREMVLQQMVKRSGAGILLVDNGVANPFYLCETGARRRGLDLAVALADAKQVAETGFAPLSPTPLAKKG